MRNSCGGGEEEEEEENDDDMEDEGAGVAETNAKPGRKKKYGSRGGMMIKARKGYVFLDRVHHYSCLVLRSPQELVLRARLAKKVFQDRVHHHS